MTVTTVSNNDLASLSECLVCFDYGLPILQCHRGHGVQQLSPKAHMLYNLLAYWDPFATWLWRKWPIQYFAFVNMPLLDVK